MDSGEGAGVERKVELAWICTNETEDGIKTARTLLASLCGAASRNRDPSRCSG